MKKYRLLHKIYQNAMEYPELAAIYYKTGNQVSDLSYYEIWFQIKECQKYYMAFEETRIGILGGNTWQWFCNAFGMIAAGLTTALLDPLAPMEDLAAAVEKSKIQILVYDADEEETAKELSEKLQGIPLREYYPLGVVLSERADPVKDFAEKEGDLLFFTSGTSKNSKAVVIPAEAMEGSMCASASRVFYTAGERVMIPIPFHHAFGFNMLNLYYLQKCPIFISSARRVMRDFATAMPSAVVAVPHMLERLYCRNLLDPAFVKSVITAGSRLPVELAQKIESLGIVVQNFYGSSEIPGGIGCSLAGDPTDALTLSEAVRVQITSEGEVWIHCPFHLREYYGSPEETKDVLEGDVIHTGDAGWLDEKGRLHLLGRKKDTIIMENGEKVFCPDVDGVIRNFKGVKDGAVIYVEKRLVAVVQTETQADLGEIRTELESYNQTQPFYRKMLDLWVCRDGFPYTTSGKLQRRLLEDSYKNRG